MRAETATSRAFLATLAAILAAVTVTRACLGQAPVLVDTVTLVPPLASLPLYLALGVAAGALAVLFNRGLLRALDLFERPGRIPFPARAAIVGASVALVGLTRPELLGGGDHLIDLTLRDRPATAVLPLLLAARLLMTWASYGCGPPGGIFAPLLALGALLGLLTSRLASPRLPTLIPEPGAPVIVGMAALFAASIRAPLTGAALLVEMTGAWPALLPLLVATLGAQATADLLGGRPLYDALLERGERPTIATKLK